jgi:hypothetical protein
MARPRKPTDPYSDLPRVLEILERELSLQREAMDKLKSATPVVRIGRRPDMSLPMRRTA